MSTGLVICSTCKREVHQDGPREYGVGKFTWQHCEDKTPMCFGAYAAYPDSEAEIVGAWCGKDGGIRS